MGRRTLWKNPKPEPGLRLREVIQPFDQKNFCSLLAQGYNFLFHCSVISELIEVNVFLNSFKSYKIVCTQSKSNRRAHGFLISKDAYDEHNFIGQLIRDVFLRILPEVGDPCR